MSLHDPRPVIGARELVEAESLAKIALDTLGPAEWCDVERIDQDALLDLAERYTERMAANKRLSPRSMILFGFQLGWIALARREAKAGNPIPAKLKRDG